MEINLGTLIQWMMHETQQQENHRMVLNPIGENCFLTCNAAL
ncbi:MAG: hypothetical protein OCD01_16180 [Fibrobacterales bacterium]